MRNQINSVAANPLMLQWNLCASQRSSRTMLLCGQVAVSKLAATLKLLKANLLRPLTAYILSIHLAASKFLLRSFRILFNNLSRLSVLLFDHQTFGSGL